ncbi:SLAP domain-containing protein [Schleiferilactobacillus perolens]|uniref:Surface layer protein A domain-containing protein n=1 Tax=Schleiferilactobacillus perolens DSM 12744 TaxID=1423792 RepID=A0A0R1MWM3_9LACO|nr:SLAP domain-containing protein [Schleiferilactobacillus perolens]KRL12527.1 hypothetical protein FD09_GL002845 [Schleiferilactobacillus perolens DSM 12744]
MKKSFVFLCSVALLTVGVTTASAVPVHAAGNDTEITDTTDSLAVLNKTGYIYFRHGEGVLSAYKDPELKIFGSEVIHFAQRYMTNQAVAAYDQIATNTKTNQVVAYHIPDGWVGLDSWTAEDLNQYAAENDFGVLTMGKQAQQLYTDSKLLTPANRTLAPGTAWRYGAKETITYKYSGKAADYAYQVGTNLWLPASVVVSKQSYRYGYSYWTHDILQVSNPAGAKVYAQGDWYNPTSKTLPYNSRWQFGQVVMSIDGDVLGFQVGGNQFVKAADVTVSDRPGIFTITRANGAATMRRDTVPTGKKLAKGSRWRTTGRLYLPGGFYYRVATNVYVSPGDGKWVAAK